MHSILNNMATQNGAMGVSSFPSSPSYFGRTTRATSSTFPLQSTLIQRRSITCSAVQESSTSTSTSTSISTSTGAYVKEVRPVEEKAAPPVSKPRAKAPTKPLPQLIEEDVIPSLKATLEAQQDISQLELSFQDNKLEGSFLKEDCPYLFWAFFPNGTVTGPKGFSSSAYGSEASTVEPFLIDEKKITGKHIVFWVQKRLAAQGIIPVWK